MSAPAGVRGRKSLRDMVLSLGVVLAVVGIVVAFEHRGGPGIRVIDPAQTYAGARNVAAYPVLLPHLPAGWRATSATNEESEGRLTMRVGWVTPTGQYAQLVESDRPAVEVFDRWLSPGLRPAGSVDVGGVPWQRLPAPQKGDLAIARTGGKVTYLVSGSAGLPELQTLAGSLR